MPGQFGDACFPFDFPFWASRGTQFQPSHSQGLLSGDWGQARKHKPIREQRMWGSVLAQAFKLFLPKREACQVAWLLDKSLYWGSLAIKVITKLAITVFILTFISSGCFLSWYIIKIWATMPRCSGKDYFHTKEKRAALVSSDIP